MEPPPLDQSHRQRPRPRNWHSASEQRRLFWILVPIMLVAAWAERTWWAPTMARPSPPIDTILGRGPVTRTIDDGVSIEAPRTDLDPPDSMAPDVVLPAPSDTFADTGDLALVRDDTVFRSDDQRAWFAIWKRLQGETGAARLRGREVTFAQVFSQPKSFRGRLVRIEGTIRRLQEVSAPTNALGIASYWQAWIEPAGGPASPIVVYFLTVPPGTPAGMRVDMPVVVDGVFFKRWAYQASDAIRLAPLLMAIEPRFPPRITGGRGTSALAGWALLSIVALIAITIVALRLAAGPPRLRRSAADRLDVDFSSVTVTDARTALRRLADLAGPPEATLPLSCDDGRPTPRDGTEVPQ